LGCAPLGHIFWLIFFFPAKITNSRKLMSFARIVIEPQRDLVIIYMTLAYLSIVGTPFMERMSQAKAALTFLMPYVNPFKSLSPFMMFEIVMTMIFEPVAV